MFMTLVTVSLVVSIPVQVIQSQHTYDYDASDYYYDSGQQVCTTFINNKFLVASPLHM